MPDYPRAPREAPLSFTLFIFTPPLPLMEWIRLRPEIMAYYLPDAQLSALETIARASTSAEPLEHAIGVVVRYMRAEIAANPLNPMNEDPTTIPDVLEHVACALIVEMLQSRLPLMELSRDQSKNAQNARALLRRIAKGDLPLGPASALEDEPEHMRVKEMRYGKIVSGAAKRRARRASLAGL